MNPKIRVDKKYDFLIINGEYYSVEFKRGKPTFIREDMDKISEMVSIAEKIAEKLKSKVDAKAIVKESVMKLHIKDIKKLYKLLFESKVTYKPKTRKHHCVDIQVGNFILPVVD